jgi:methionine-rich copper-binding protein CopC
MLPFRRALLLAGSALLFATGATPDAPLSLVHAEPAAGGLFSAAPARIRLIFSEQLDKSKSKSKLSLVATDGRTIRLTAVIDPHLFDAIIAPVPPLSPGTYRVDWSIVAATGVSLSGSYAFSFGASGSPPPKKS